MRVRAFVWERFAEVHHYGIMPVELQIFTKELERALACQPGRLRIIVLALVAIEAVTGPIHVNRQLRVLRTDLINL
jgi:hypothetical protein